MSIERPRFIIGNAELDISQTARVMLLGGFAAEAYRVHEGGGVYSRAVNISESREFSLQKPIVGYGKDTTVEMAIIRALYTFGENSRTHVEPTVIPESEQGIILPGLTGPSQLDDMFTQDTDLWIARGESGRIEAGVGGSGASLQVSGGDMFETLATLAEGYHFIRNTYADHTELDRPPVTLF